MVMLAGLCKLKPTDHLLFSSLAGYYPNIPIQQWYVLNYASSLEASISIRFEFQHHYSYFRTHTRVPYLLQFTVVPNLSMSICQDKTWETGQIT